MRVYPILQWKPAMDKFAYDNDLDIGSSNDVKVFKLETECKKFMFIHINKKNSQSKQVIDISERRKRNGN